MSRTVGSKMPESFEQWSDEMDVIMDTAVKKAIEENHRLGLDQCYSTEDQDSPVVREDGADE